jgi:hypothetical protein
MGDHWSDWDFKKKMGKKIISMKNMKNIPERRQFHYATRRFIPAGLPLLFIQDLFFAWFRPLKKKYRKDGKRGKRGTGCRILNHMAFFQMDSIIRQWKGFQSCGRRRRGIRMV